MLTVLLVLKKRMKPFHQNQYNYKMKNGEKWTCFEKHAFDVSEMPITSIITCINMTHTICIVDE